MGSGKCRAIAPEAAYGIGRLLETLVGNCFACELAGCGAGVEQESTATKVKEIRMAKAPQKILLRIIRWKW